MNHPTARTVLRMLLPLTLGCSMAAADGLDASLRAMVEAVVATRERFVDPQASAHPGALQAAMRAYLSSFGDAATRYLSPDEWGRLETAARGQFQGYGVLIMRRDDSFWIEKAYPRAPAHLAGLRAGDQLVEVGGHRDLPSTLAELRRMLHAGSDGVVVGIRRRGQELRVALRKGAVSLPSLDDTRLHSGVHYLRLRSFTERGPDELAALLPRARDARGVILDMRGNAGGVLDAAVAMHGLFAGPGPVTWIVDRTQHRAERRTRLRPSLPAPPAVILVDNQTASAAEVLAASLRRAGSLIVGEQTYGKGTVQEVVPLADGGAAVITVARYEVSPGVPLPESGITPDILVPRTESIPFPPVPGADPVLDHAIQLLLGAGD